MNVRADGQASGTSPHRVVFPVPRSDPELAVIDVGGDHFLVPSLSILAADEFNQGVVYVGPLRQEETAAWTELMEEEQLLFLVGGGEKERGWREEERESGGGKEEEEGRKETARG